MLKKKGSWINKSYNYISDIEDSDFKKVIKQGLLKVTSNGGICP